LIEEHCSISLTNSCQANICLQTPSQTTPCLFTLCQPSNRPISNCLPPTCLTPPCVPPACIPFPARAINCYLGGSYCSYNEGIFNSNGKETMQILNDRLACYLEKVKSLEKENADLECKIQEWHKNQPSYECTDFNCCYRTIEELQQQICCTKADNARLCLDTDNLKATSHDYAIKTDYEKGLRQSAETDINGLRRVLDDLTLCKADLEAQLESLTEEHILRKKDHEKVREGILPNLFDLFYNYIVHTVIISGVRKDYEAIIEKNRQGLEAWYKEQTATVSPMATVNPQEIQSNESEIKGLRCTFQTLEIELQAQFSKKRALEGTLAETQSHYTFQLQNIKQLISNCEEELSQLRQDIKCQNNQYKILLGIKTRLEKEISTYRQLLEGNGVGGMPGSPCASHPGREGSGEALESLKLT
uniref:Keratin 23 n=1 Tax=Pelusios castaneus TaxID=367368 RepID=A0A8C8S775_9SAUR